VKDLKILLAVFISIIFLILKHGVNKQTVTAQSEAEILRAA